jgi:integrase
MTGIQSARRLQAKFKAEVQRVDSAAHRGKAPDVESFGEAWRATQVHAPGSEQGLEATLRLRIYPTLGRLKVDQVNHLTATLFVKELRESDLAVSTQGRIDTHVRALFRAVVDTGWREASPFARVPRIKVTRRAAQRQNEYVPSIAEALFLADLAEDEGRVDVWAFIRVAAGTGLRGGELVGLTVDELDYPNPSVIDLRHQLQRTTQLGFYMCPPKSDAGIRRVPLASWVAETLAVFSATRRPYRVTLPWVERGKVRGERDVALLMPSRYGPAPLHESVMARAVRVLAERAGLPGRVTPHSLRRTYTTMLGDAGVPLRAIDYVTGHESNGLTLGTYTAVTAGALAKVRAATDAAYTHGRASKLAAVAL